LEKIIQIEIKITNPTAEQIKDYVQYLNPKCPAEFIDLISLSGIKNPRRIKRALNLISLRKYSGKERAGKLEIAFLWTMFEEVMTKEKAANFYSAIGGPGQFYDFLNRVNEVDIRQSGITDHEKALE
jgi:hypothetical protein